MNELHEILKKIPEKKKPTNCYIKMTKCRFFLRNGGLVLLNGGVLNGDYLNHKSSNEEFVDWIKKMNKI